MVESASTRGFRCIYQEMQDNSLYKVVESENY